MNKRAALFIIPILALTSFLLAYPTEELRISFVGDLMAHDVNYEIKDYAVIYDEVKPLFLADDLTITNLEAPVNEKDRFQTYPRFNMNRSYVKAAIDAGIDVFSLSNNHSFDQGEPGVVQTLCSMLMLREYGKSGIFFSGIRIDPKKDYDVATIRKKGWKIGFCAVTQFLNIRQTKPYLYVVDIRNTSRAREFINFVRRVSRDFDLFIVSMHADVEFNRKPDPRKAEFFKELIGAGCHIVFGHHPHVLQPYELVETGGKKGFIMYSMGNFISGMRWKSVPYPVDHYRSDTGDSIILPVCVVRDEQGVAIRPQDPILITNHINERNEIVIRRYDTILSEKLSAEWMTYYKKRFDNMREFIDRFRHIRTDAN